MMRLKSMRALVAVLAAAGCGSGSSSSVTGSSGNSEITEGPVTREEMAEVERAISEHQNVECRRPRVVPLLNCVEQLPNGRYKAHFGYNNPNASAVSVDVGNLNKFVPNPRDRGQPEDFQVGVHNNVFTVTWSGSPLTWILTTNYVIATRNSPRCGPPPPMCPATCDDGNPCTVDRCGADTQFLCVHTNVSDGMACSDGNVCNGAETCRMGACVAGTPLQCDDNNTCTTDTCNPQSGCQHANVADGTSCPASGACNQAGQCQAGQCEAGPGVNCDDNNPCTADSCDALTGACNHVPVSNGTSCTDGDACNGAETCENGTCTPGTPPVCADTNPCTNDSCNPQTGCVFAPAPDGTVCSGTSCGSASTCQGGLCTPSNGPNCDDGNPCTADSCAPDGSCIHTPVADGTSCADQNACNGQEVCGGGICQTGTPVVCGAPDQCHAVGTCDPATGQCSNPPVANGTSCSDGNGCTQNDACNSGACVGGPLVTCTPRDACHSAGTCDPASGQCSDPPVNDGTSCSDNNACNGAEVCQGGVCTPGTPLACDDGNPCTADTCDAAGGCTRTPVPNGTECAPATQCSDASTCQNGQCTPGGGRSCDDGNPCTADGCDAAGNCTHTSAPDGTSCSDGNACNGVEACVSGACAQGTPVVCTASDQCHAVGTCDPATGACSNPPVADGTACNDGNACSNNDVCRAGACTSGSPVVCSASDACHVAGTCDPANGSCSNPPAADGTSCNDGNGCTTGDACRAGSCAGGSPVTCSASDQCHVAGTCDPASGACSNPTAADGTSCNDGNGCSTGDACHSGACQGAPVVCTASDQCHVAGTCDPASGACSNPAAPNGTACTDQNACTQNDICQNGACAAGAPLVCTADPNCTPGTCNPATGVCSPQTCAPTCPTRQFAKGYDTPLVGGEALDPAGNLYITGGLAGSIDFGTGPLTTNGSSDLYVAKIDPVTGLAVWSFNKGDDVDQLGVNITADRVGHVAVTGTYIGALNLGGSAPNLTAATDSIFLAGLNAATGAALWAKNIDLGGGALLGIATDPTDNGVVVTGFTGIGAAANFGGGPLVSGGGKDVVVAKFDSATGALLWAKQYGGTLDQLSNAVAVDATGRVFITGQYSGALDFGFGVPLPTAASSAKRIFVARLDGATGNGQASRSIGTTGQQQSVAITIDGSGNVVIGGSMIGTVDFGTGSPLVSAGAQDAFVAKLPGDLAPTVWAKRFGDATPQNSKGVAIDGSGDVVVTGLFQGAMDFSPVATLTSAGAFDAFIATLSGADGSPKCAVAAGDGADQAAARVVVDGATGRQFVLGTFISQITWDGGGTITGSPTASQTFLVERR